MNIPVGICWRSDGHCSAYCHEEVHSRKDAERLLMEHVNSCKRRNRITHCSYKIEIMTKEKFDGQVQNERYFEDDGQTTESVPKESK